MPNFTPKEERQAEHIEKSEEKEGKSSEKAKSIGIATVVKHKHKAKKLEVHKPRDPKPKNDSVFDEIQGWFGF